MTSTPEGKVTSTNFIAAYCFWCGQHHDKRMICAGMYPMEDDSREARMYSEIQRLEKLLSERGDIERLREIEHLAWHVMDASEENAQTGEVTITPMREDYDRLSELLPEGHPDIEGANATHNDEPPCSERT